MFSKQHSVVVVGALIGLALVVSAPAHAESPSSAALAAPQPAALAPDVTQCLDANETSIARENDAKWLDARVSLRTCAASSCPREIRDECQRRLNELERAIPSVLFEFTDAAGQRVKDVRIQRDGAFVTAGEDGLVEADPGAHTFTFAAPGYAPVETRLVLTAQQQQRRERISFTAPTAAPSAAAPAPTSGSGLHGQRLTAVILGGTSVVAAGLGTTFGFIALHRDHQVDEACDGHFCADAADTERSKRAVAAGNLSTVFFAVAALTAGSGLYLWLTAPKPQAIGAVLPKQRALRVGLGPGSVELGGTF